MFPEANNRTEVVIADEETSMLAAIQAGREDTVVKLLSCYSGVKTDSGWTVLHMVVALGCEHVVEELVKRNADVNAVAASGDTPLHVAAARERSNREEVFGERG